MHSTKRSSKNGSHLKNIVDARNICPKIKNEFFDKHTFCCWHQHHATQHKERRLPFCVDQNQWLLQCKQQKKSFQANRITRTSVKCDPSKYICIYLIWNILNSISTLLLWAQQPIPRKKHFSVHEWYFMPEKYAQTFSISKCRLPCICMSVWNTQLCEKHSQSPTHSMRNTNCRTKRRKYFLTLGHTLGRLFETNVNALHLYWYMLYTTEIFESYRLKATIRTNHQLNSAFSPF